MKKPQLLSSEQINRATKEDIPRLEAKKQELVAYIKTDFKRGFDQPGRTTGANILGGIGGYYGKLFGSIANPRGIYSAAVGGGAFINDKGLNLNQVLPSWSGMGYTKESKEAARNIAAINKKINSLNESSEDNTWDKETAKQYETGERMPETVEQYYARLLHIYKSLPSKASDVAWLKSSNDWIQSIPKDMVQQLRDYAEDRIDKDFNQ